MPALPQELVHSLCLSGSPFSTHRNTQVLPSPPHRTVFLHIPTHASTEHLACSFSSVLFPLLLRFLSCCIVACPPLHGHDSMSGVLWENSEVTDVTVPVCTRQGWNHCWDRQGNLGALQHQVLAPGHLGIPGFHRTVGRTSCHREESRTAALLPRLYRLQFIPFKWLFCVSLLF